MAKSLKDRLTAHITAQARATNYTPDLSSFAVDISAFHGELKVAYWENKSIELPDGLGQAFFTWDGQSDNRLTLLVMVPNDLAHEINQRGGDFSIPGGPYHHEGRAIKGRVGSPPESKYNLRGRRR